ncbi:MAG TPA: molybdate ABC transporter substrate-binding protein [Burkholderiales bacterium]|nr:molybdate ABC transporter substrate-binding protein [Burkholderiales bacterium]
MRLGSRGMAFAHALLFVLVATFPARAAETVTVFAAASLKDALDENAKAYQAQSGDRVAVAYAASSALARQIEAGAPADIFISADLDWMDYVERRHLVKADTRRNLLRNRLVLIAPADSKASVDIGPRFPLAKLLGNGRLAMANPDAVPAGKYGKASLEALGVWRDVQAKVASAENVRAALVLVSRGEAPFGIVYRTDAAVEPKVRVVGLFPENTHPPIVYPMAMTATSKAAAANFVSWLNRPEARAIFAKYGF